VVRAVRAAAPEKKIWAYSGYEIDDILEDELRSALLQEIDILVDGRFVDELKDGFHVINAYRKPLLAPL